MANGTNEVVGGRRSKWIWYWLLLIPFIATLWVPFYNSRDPEFAGFPFFYWYLFLWIIISSVLTATVYYVTRSE